MPVIISPNMVLGRSPGDLPPFPLTHAMIGYKTICTLDNVIASSETAGNPATDAVNVFTNEYWRPNALPASWTCDAGSGVDVDYFGIAGHTLGTFGCTVGFEYSADGLAWTSLFSFIPENNNPIMVIFEVVTARHWRVVVSGGTGIPRLAVIYIGEMLQMQRPIYGGHRPISLNRETIYDNLMSDAGQFQARSVKRKGQSTEYAWQNLTALWYRQFFDPFVKVARTRPFFIAWRPVTFPNEVGYVWTASDPKPSNMGTLDLMQVSLEVAGVGDD